MSRRRLDVSALDALLDAAPPAGRPAGAAPAPRLADAAAPPAPPPGPPPAGEVTAAVPPELARATPSLTSATSATSARAGADAARPASGLPAVPPAAPARRPMTVDLPSALVDRAHSAVYWTPGLTLRRLVEEGLELALARYEDVPGGPHPPARGPLRTGQPVRPPG